MSGEVNKNYSSYIVLLVMSGLLLLFLLLKNSGLYTSVYDEYVYSKFSRLVPLSESSIPGYLYLAVYGFTNYCGEGFLGCAKILNAVFFVAAIPFIYLVARSAANRTRSVVVALLAVLGPINSYTAYFMPESFYFLGFWAFSWFLLRINSDSHKWVWFLAGAVYGMSALIKPHALLLFPAVLMYIFYVFFREKKVNSLDFCAVLLLFVFGVFLVKFAVGYLLAGQSGITVFGPFYGKIATSTSANIDRYLRLLMLSYENVKGHLLVFAVIYGLPIVLAFTLLFQQFVGRTGCGRKKLPTTPIERIVFYSLIVIVNLICVTAIFTASMADAASSETPYRLHMRYYNFALPLFYIVAAGALGVVETTKKGYGRYLLCIGVGALVLFAIYTNLAPYTPNYVDSPEVRGLHSNKVVFQIFGIFSLLVLCLWGWVGRIGISIYFYFVLPLFVVASTYSVTVEQRHRIVQDVHDRAGLFTKQYLSPDDLPKVLIVGSSPSGLFRSLYYLDNVMASLKVIPPGSVYDISSLPPGKEWILLIGDHVMPEHVLFQLPMKGFTLGRVVGSNVIDFNKNSWPGVINKVKGLSEAGSRGTWSMDDVVEFEFTAPLPEKFSIVLVACAFGPNINKEFTAVVGDSLSKFVLTENSSAEQVLFFDNPKRSKVLTIRVPAATSPKTLGVGDGQRRLGIGLERMTIRPE